MIIYVAYDKEGVNVAEFKDIDYEKFDEFLKSHPEIVRVESRGGCCD